MRYICIHGHFYQPPRENPWTNHIDIQSSAAPFANWNQRITQECYMANTKAEILDSNGKVVQRVNNYHHISFNFGPTLLRWFDNEHSNFVEKLVQADKDSISKYGSGTAIAQVFHHAILPLCTLEDKRTEVKWGIADFQKRFGRKPEGIWLAETAVDLETLEVLVENDILFTILAPRQAKAILVGESYQEIQEHQLDTSRPYWCQLPNGKKIALFFYNGEIAMDIAFRGALNNGERFAQKLHDIARKLPENALLHCATDGESYGHHHRYGEMALAFCVETLKTYDDVQMINYSAYLKKFPPTQYIEIQEVSSWSCAHGVGRWSANCGCCIDPQMQNQQEWRKHLRTALNLLRDRSLEWAISEVNKVQIDFFELRNYWGSASTTYEEIALMGRLSSKMLRENEITEIQFWMVQQELALKMFTSCGWFFDTPVGLEPIQILRYAKLLIEMLEIKDKNRCLLIKLDFLDALSLIQYKGQSGYDIWKKLV